MRKKDPTIIRVDDIVEIVESEFFERCGYPIDIKKQKEIILRNYRETIKEFVNDFPFNSSNISNWNDGCFERTLIKIADALAYNYVYYNNFGGRQRKIYTHSQPDLKGVLMKVYRIKFVKTGLYIPGSGDHEDYDPAYLSNVETHKILYGWLNVRTGRFTSETAMIEAKNVRKVNNDTSK